MAGPKFGPRAIVKLSSAGRRTTLGKSLPVTDGLIVERVFRVVGADKPHYAAILSHPDYPDMRRTVDVDLLEPA